MVFLENLKSQLESFRPKIKELHDVFDIENSKERILELQEKAAEPGFWDDHEKSQPVLKETRTLEGHIEKYEKITSAFDDIEVMIEMAAEEEDSEEIVADDTLVRLISMPNVIVTSHQAFLTKEALRRIAEITLGNLKSYFDGEELENAIITKRKVFTTD